MKLNFILLAVLSACCLVAAQRSTDRLFPRRRLRRPTLAPQQISTTEPLLTTSTEPGAGEAVEEPSTTQGPQMRFRASGRRPAPFPSRSKGTTEANTVAAVTTEVPSTTLPPRIRFRSRGSSSFRNSFLRSGQPSIISETQPAPVSQRGSRRPSRRRLVVEPLSDHESVENVAKTTNTHVLIPRQERLQQLRQINRPVFIKPEVEAPVHVEEEPEAVLVDEMVKSEIKTKLSEQTKKTVDTMTVKVAEEITAITADEKTLSVMKSGNPDIKKTELDEGDSLSLSLPTISPELLTGAAPNIKKPIHVNTLLRFRASRPTSAARARSSPRSRGRATDEPVTLIPAETSSRVELPLLLQRNSGRGASRVRGGSVSMTGDASDDSTDEAPPRGGRTRSRFARRRPQTARGDLVAHPAQDQADQDAQAQEPTGRKGRTRSRLPPYDLLRLRSIRLQHASAPTTAATTTAITTTSAATTATTTTSAATTTAITTTSAATTTITPTATTPTTTITTATPTTTVASDETPTPTETTTILEMIDELTTAVPTESTTELGASEAHVTELYDDLSLPAVEETTDASTTLPDIEQIHQHVMTDEKEFSTHVGFHSDKGVYVVHATEIHEPDAPFSETFTQNAADNFIAHIIINATVLNFAEETQTDPLVEDRDTVQATSDESESLTKLPAPEGVATAHSDDLTLAAEDTADTTKKPDNIEQFPTHRRSDNRREFSTNFLSHNGNEKHVIRTTEFHGQDVSIAQPAHHNLATHAVTATESPFDHNTSTTDAPMQEPIPATTAPVTRRRLRLIKTTPLDKSSATTARPNTNNVRDPHHRSPGMSLNSRRPIQTGLVSALVRRTLVHRARSIDTSNVAPENILNSARSSTKVSGHENVSGRATVPSLPIITKAIKQSKININFQTINKPSNQNQPQNKNNKKNTDIQILDTAISNQNKMNISNLTNVSEPPLQQTEGHINSPPTTRTPGVPSSVALEEQEQRHSSRRRGQPPRQRYSAASDLTFFKGVVVVSEVGTVEDSPPHQVATILAGLGGRRRGLARPPKPATVTTTTISTITPVVQQDKGDFDPDLFDYYDYYYY